MKILIVDDHTIVRMGIKQILADGLKGATFGEADTGRMALEQVRKEHWDGVVLDVTLPGHSGLDVLKEIKHERPKLPVLVLSMHPEDQFAVRIIKAGASGYMTKECAADEIVGAMKRLLVGGRYVSRTLAEKMAELIATDVQSLPHERLSDREFLVLLLIASGKPVGEIALELTLSVKTVSTYRARLLLKMGLRNNAELVRYAFNHQLVDQPFPPSQRQPDTIGK
jgi:two-component system invasion response regulator UvrY